MSAQTENLNVFSEVFIAIEDLTPVVRREVDKLPKNRDYTEIKKEQ